MRKVFIPSLPTRFDAVTGTRIPSLDLNPASNYGELVVWTRGPHEPDDISAAAKTVTRMSHAVKEDDYVLAAGDLIVAAAAIAAIHKRLGKVKLLRWDRRVKKYDVMEVSW